MSKRIPRVYVAGIGGFAARHHEALYQLESDRLLKVNAVCDPLLDSLQDRLEEFAFEKRGIALYRDFNVMLDRFSEASEAGDWVSIAAPIPFHAEMHRNCVSRGLACYLEKPPTLDPVELEQMIECDRSADKPTAVGFNHIGQAGRLYLKSRLISGDFGALQTASFVGAWRRSSGYFTRSAWAGQLMLDGQLVLDSCLGNGMAHHVHNLLFFCGQDELYSWGRCEEVAAELYSANCTVGPDTLFVEGRMREGGRLRLALTNSFDGPEYSSEEMVFERAQVVINPNHGIEIKWHSGQSEFIPLPSSFPLEANFRAYVNYLQGCNERPATTLVDCRSIVELNAMAFLAGQTVHRLSAGEYAVIPSEQEGKSVRYIPGILELQRSFVETGVFPSDTDCLWARPGGSATLSDVADLHAYIEQMDKRLKWVSLTVG